MEIDLSVHGEKLDDVSQFYHDFANKCEEKLRLIDQTAINLSRLSLNASIEAIHAAAFLDAFQNVITENMSIQARALALILDGCIGAADYGDLKQALSECRLDEAFITDAEGMVCHTNRPGPAGGKLSGFDSFVGKLKENPAGCLILPKEFLPSGSYRMRIVINRLDGRGVIQLGCSYELPKGRLTIDSFSVVAGEVRKQAGEFEKETRKIDRLFTELRRFIEEFRESKEPEKLVQIRKSIRHAVPMIEQISQIARLTNLLGVRAKIEAAQSTNDVSDFDRLLNFHMYIEAKLCFYVIPDGEMEYGDAQQLVDQIGLNEVWITDRNAVVNITNVDGGKGFQFSSEGQTGPFMVLLTDGNIMVAAPPAPRSLDGKVFKFLGIQRRGGGILQIGNKAELYGQNTAAGFMLVAEEVQLMANKAGAVSEELLDMLQEEKPPYFAGVSAAELLAIL